MGAEGQPAVEGHGDGPATGRRPVLREVITLRNSRTEKVMLSAERQQSEELRVQENIARAQSSLKVAAHQQTREKSERNEKTSPPSPIPRKLLAATILLGVLLTLVCWLRRR